MQVEVQEAYGKQDPRRYPLDPPDPKSVTGEDSSTHNRGVGGPLPRLPLSVQPGEVLVQVWPPPSLPLQCHLLCLHNNICCHKSHNNTSLPCDRQCGLQGKASSESHRVHTFRLMAPGLHVVSKSAEAHRENGDSLGTNIASSVSNMTYLGSFCKTMLCGADC